MLTVYESFFACFSHGFLIFNGWKIDIEMFILRLPIYVHVSKKVFGIMNK